MIIKEYNSDREKLIFPEYGRHIQNMIKELLTIEDRRLRTAQAHLVIEVMGNLNSVLRDTDDFRHKLWDHLFILSEFKLDVDSPHPIPTPEELELKPEVLQYPSRRIRYKQYGQNIRNVINLIKDKDDCEQKSEMVADIAKFMKYKSYEYNQEYPSDEVVLNDLMAFSNGEIFIEGDALLGTKISTHKRTRTQHGKSLQQRRDSNQRNNQHRSGANQQQNRRQLKSGGSYQRKYH